MSFSELRKLRENIVRLVFQTPPLLLATFLCKEGVREKIFNLSNSTLLYEELNRDEEKLLVLLQDSCVNEKNIEKLIPSWLAIQLFLWPHKVETSFQPGEIIKHLRHGLLVVGIALLLRAPQIFKELGEVDQYLKFLQMVTAEIKEIVLCEDWVEREFVAKLFLYFCKSYKLYFSCSDLRKFMELRSAILELVVDLTEVEALDYDFSNYGFDGKRQLHLAVLVPKLSPRSEIFVMIPFLKELDRNRYTVTLYTWDLFSRQSECFFRSMVDDLRVLPYDLRQCVRQIRGEKPDILLFCTNMVAGAGSIERLTAYRLAPVQMVETCCPVTTGIGNIDYYLSGTLTEPPGAEEFYSEKLVQIEGPAQAYHFFPEEKSKAAEKKWNRASLGLPDNALIFISGANANKIIPELLQLWSQILAAVPNSYLVLYPFNKNWQNEYPVAAFMRLLIDFSDRYQIDARRWKVLTESFAGREELLSMIGCADIYLDSIRHSGAVSMLDPLLMGVPPVVIEGDYGRGRQASAILRSLGLEEYVCRSEAEYVDFAVRLARDKSLRAAYAGQIREKMADNPVIFDCKRYAKEFDRVLTKIADRHLR